MPVPTYSHICSQQKGFLVSMVSGGSQDSTCYSSLHMCCVHIGTAISKKKKSAFLKYFSMDNIFCQKSAQYQSYSKKRHDPQIPLNCSTMVHQLLGNTLSRTGGATLLCCKTDYVLCPRTVLIQCQRSINFKKDTLQNPNMLPLKNKEKYSK